MTQRLEAMKVGSLCTGILGAELALDLMGLDPDLRWYSEIDRDACQVLSERVPGVPNLGDLKLIEWERVEPVDALVAGYPCQPFSTAGKRKGTDDHRHLWPHIFDALRVLRPQYCFLENVSAHLTLGFDVVLRDLASAGFDAEWTTLRASDVGSCHGRDRLWVIVTDPRGDEPERWRRVGNLDGPPGEREREAPERQRLRDAALHSGSTASDPDNGAIVGQRTCQELGEGSEVAPYPDQRRLEMGTNRGGVCELRNHSH